MQYKLYRYTISNEDGRPIGPDKHFDLFNRSKGTDEFGELTNYRNKKNAILMYVQNYRPDFSGLVGKHEVEREITTYDKETDLARPRTVRDDDYPHAAFICFPRLHILACVEGSQVNASTAISRLHAILAHRQGVQFVAEPFTETVDLRRATKKFRIVRVEYEVVPVNPHTKDLGMQLDESQKLDHIKRMLGALDGSPAHPLELNGGFLTQIQQLQESGHGRVGFTGLDDQNTEIKVPKPRHARPLAEDEDQELPGNSQEIKITLAGLRISYPFTVGHVRYVRRIATALVGDDE